MRKYKTTGNTTLFDKEDTERKLTEMGDPLERLSKTIDFEMFRPELEDALLPQKFVDYLNGKGLIFNEGRMIDASFVSVPRQRNTPDENKRIKAGRAKGCGSLGKATARRT